MCIPHEMDAHFGTWNVYVNQSDFVCQNMSYIYTHLISASEDHLLDQCLGCMCVQ